MATAQLCFDDFSFFFLNRFYFAQNCNRNPGTDLNLLTNQITSSGVKQENKHGGQTGVENEWSMRRVFLNIKY